MSIISFFFPAPEKRCFGKEPCPLDLAFVDMSHIYKIPSCAFINKHNDNFITTRDSLNMTFHDMSDIAEISNEKREECIKLLPEGFFKEED